jgi:hypothetical protein
MPIITIRSFITIITVSCSVLTVVDRILIFQGSLVVSGMLLQLNYWRARPAVIE